MKPLFFLSLLLITPMLLAAQSTSGYCLNKGTRGNAWLQKVSIGNWSFNTGGNSGYLYQPDSKLVLNADTSYSVQLELGGYPRVQDSAYWRIWIDFNRDMDFEDAGEQVIQLKTVYKGVAKGVITLPQSLAAGDYMLRVSVSKSKFSAACSTDATVLETEDYRFKINAAPPCPRPMASQIRAQKIKFEQALVTIKGTNAIRYNWHVVSENGKYAQYFWGLTTDSLPLTSLSNNTTYKVQVQTECDTGKSNWSDYAVFKTFDRGASCLAIDEAFIVINQPSNQSFIFSCTAPNVARVEWRYRIAGASEWTYFVYYNSLDSSVEAFFSIADTTYEIQVRGYCPNLFNFGEWSEVIYKEAKSCVLPPQRDLELVENFSAYPDLKMNIAAYRHTLEAFEIKWQYREDGDTTWVDTLKLYGRELQITGLQAEKKYDLKATLSCGGDSVTVLKQVKMPPTCQKIPSYFIKVENLQDSTAKVVVSNQIRRAYEVRYRAVGDSAYIVLPLTDQGISGLNLNYEYELSVRVVCEDSIPDWSDPVFFTNYSCQLPERGEIALLKFHSLDSARFRVEFFDFTHKPNFTYAWKYKDAKSKTWITPEVNGGREFVLTKMKTGIKYDLQVVIFCPNAPTDSLVFVHTLTAQPDQCTEKPALNLIKVENPLGSPKIYVEVVPPRRGYLFQMRLRPENAKDYKGYFPPWPDGYTVVLHLYPGINDFQYRFICPNGNVSPWSDILKVRNHLEGLIENEASELAFKSDQTELETAQQNPLFIAPNPSSGQLSIIFPEEMEPQPEAYLEVLNTAGQRIWSLKTAIDPAQTLPIDLSKQAPGLYILRIQAGQKVYTERIMIGSNR